MDNKYLKDLEDMPRYSNFILIMKKQFNHDVSDDEIEKAINFKNDCIRFSKNLNKQTNEIILKCLKEEKEKSHDR